MKHGTLFYDEKNDVCYIRFGFAMFYGALPDKSLLEVFYDGKWEIVMLTHMGRWSIGLRDFSLPATSKLKVRIHKLIEGCTLEMRVDLAS